MKKLFVTLFCLTLLFSVNGQNFGGCGYVADSSGEPESQDCTNNSETYLTKYRTPLFWRPDTLTPIKTILVNYVVCNKDDGTGGWIDTPAMRAEAEKMFDSINQYYSNVPVKGYSLTCEPTIDYISDTRIRFKLNEVYFIDSTNLHLLWQNSFSESDVLNYLFSEHPEAKYQLNHIFSMPDTVPQGTPWGHYGTMGSSQSFVSTRSSMFSPEYVVWNDHINHIAHEYGHAVGLGHLYNSEYLDMSHFDYLNDVLGDCGEPGCCTPAAGFACYLTDSCFWNIQPSPPALMSGHTDSVPKYISPKQAGRMNRDLSLYNNEFKIPNKNMHKYVEEITPYQYDYVLEEDETWDFKIKMYQNIRVPADVTLTIQCEVMMPNDGKIIVEPGGKLFIDGGKVTNFYYLDAARLGLWKGIEVHGTDSLVQNATNSGVVQLKNGAIIEHAYNGVRTISENGGSLDWSKTGGVIYCDSATFLNCRRGIEFMSYHNVNGSGVESNNQSYVYKGKFITNEVLPASINPAVGISLYDVKGVTIKNCLFENQRSDLDTLAITRRGSGIFSIDASYNVEAGYALGTGNPVADSENEFYNLFYGIMTTGGTSISRVRVLDNKFQNCAYSVGLHGCNYGVVGRNEMILPGADYSFQDPYTGNWYNYGMGVYSIGSYGFNVEANAFSSFNATESFNDMAVFSDNSSHVSAGKVYRNTIDNVTVGTQTQNNNLLLAIDCNEHTKGSISSFDLHAASGSLADQGAGSGAGDGVKNTADTCNNQTLHQIYKGFSNDFMYFYESGSLSSSCHNIGADAVENFTSSNECENTLRNRITTSVPTTVGNLSASLLVINDSITSFQSQLAIAKGAAKDTLESAIRVYHNKRLNTINSIVATYLDTMWMDSAATFLEHEGSIESMMMYTNIQMQRDSNKVLAWLGAIRDSADYYATLGDGPRVAEIRAFCNFQEFLLPIVNRSGGYYSMSAAEIDSIDAYADSSVAVSANARSIKYFLDQQQPVISGADLPSGERWAEPSMNRSTTNEKIDFIAVPNPTEGRVVFYVSDLATEGMLIHITDLQGRSISTIQVKDGAAEFNFAQQPNGVYFGKLLKNGELVSTIKVLNVH